MCVIMLKNFFVIVVVKLAVFTVNMVVLVKMAVLVCVGQATVGMFVGVNVLVQMCVLQAYGVAHHKVGGHKHNCKGKIKLKSWPFP